MTKLIMSGTFEYARAQEIIVHISSEREIPESSSDVHSSRGYEAKIFFERLVSC